MPGSREPSRVTQFPWNGSKRWLLPEIQAVTAAWGGHGRYIEPFVGGGCVARMVLGQHAGVQAMLGDANPWMAAWYEWQATGQPYVLPANYADVAYWRGLTDADLFCLSLADCATRFGVCLQTAWGNRWKTEADGRFTTSSAPLQKQWCDPAYLRPKLEAMLSPDPALKGVSVRCADWRVLAEQAVQGDLLYLDPPYTETLGYGNQLWTLADQLDVVDLAAELVKKGVAVVVSNHADIDRLYRRAGFSVKHFQSGRATKTRANRVEMLAWANLDHRSCRGRSS